MYSNIREIWEIENKIKETLKQYDLPLEIMDYEYIQGVEFYNDDDPSIEPFAHYSLDAIEELLGVEGTSYGEIIVYDKLAFLKAELATLAKLKLFL